MMKPAKKLCLLFLTVVFCVCSIVLTTMLVGALDETGSCGKNASWTFDKETGTLTISGTGAIMDYASKKSPFYRQAEITSVVIENGITTLGNYVFSSCKFLSKVTIPDSVKKIRKAVFQSCPRLADLELPDGLTMIGSHAFEGCNALKAIEIPDSVTEIHKNAFSGCLTLTDVKLSQTLTSIDSYVFSNCTALAQITLPDSVTLIDEGAFSLCDELTAIQLPAQLESIGESAFSQCAALRNIDIPDNVRTIGMAAFQECESLTAVTFGKNVETIGAWAFLESGLEMIQVDPENPFIMSNADGCVLSKDQTVFVLYPCASARKTYTVPATVTQIGELAFASCRNLAELVIGDNVQSIGNASFVESPALSRVTIGKNVSVIGLLAFYDSGLESIEVDPGNDTFASDDNGCLYNKAQTVLLQYTVGHPRTSFTVPAGVTRIGDYAFSGAGNLTAVTLYDGITNVGPYAFMFCNALTDVNYTGTEAQWQAISIDENGNDLLTEASLHCNYDPSVQTDVCRWCGKSHDGGFFQKIIAWFHNIFAAMFGARFA